MYQRLKGRIMKTLIKKIGAPVIFGSLLVGLAPAITHADTSGGIGGGGGQGGGSGQHWVSITKSSSESAYQRFLKESGYPRSYTEQYIRGTGAKVDVCERSNVIWFVRSGNNSKWS